MFVEEKKNLEGKGGKYLDNKNIFEEEKENRERKGGKYIGEGKIVAGWDGEVEGSTRGSRGPKKDQKGLTLH